MQRDWMLKLRHSLHAQVRRLSSDTRGMVAVEFVLTLPLMLMIFFGTIQVSTAVAVDRKVSIAARTLANLISQTLTATVIWSKATTNATAHARDSTVTTLVPAALRVGGTYLIMSEVTYNYQP